MAMGKHRTPEMLLADALRKVEALKVQVAQSSLVNDPRMKSLLNEEKELKKELLKVARWLDPENGLTNRISKLNQQIAEAESNLANAENRSDEIHARLDELKADKEELAAELNTADILEQNG